MTIEEGGDLVFIFLKSIGTGAVDQDPVFRKCGIGVFEEISLDHGEMQDPAFAVCIQDLRILPDHPFTAARNIEQHDIRTSFEDPAQFKGIFRGHDRIPETQPLEILAQCLRPFVRYIVGDQAGDIRSVICVYGFSARSGA